MAEPLLEMTPEGFDELERMFEKSPEVLNGAVLAIMRSIGRLLVPALKAETPVGATRRLRNTTVAQVRGRVVADLKVEIRQSAQSPNQFPYGRAVRGGTRPHFPPFRALIPWVESKLNVNPADAPGVAFVIARKISQVGTEPNPYHIKTFQSKVGEMDRIVSDEMAKAGERMVAIGNR